MPGTEIEPIPAATVVPANLGDIEYAELLKLIARSPDPEKLPAKLPAPAKIKPKESQAIKALPAVFGSVVPDERRVLTPDEIESLLKELANIDVVANLTKKRKEDIRTTLFNHWDSEYEASHTTEECNATPRNKDGHYVVEGVVDGEDLSYQRTVREGSVSLNADDLKALAEDPDHPEFTHSDYLDMTEQVRVLKEDKIMDKIRKNPALVSVLSLVTTRGNKVAAFSKKG